MTSNEIAIINHTAVDTLDDKLRYCQMLAKADILPRNYREKPANLLYAIEYADSLGVSRMAALTGIHIIEGKPSASADLIAGLIRRSGHKLRVPISSDTECVVQIIRADDPDFTFEARWDTEKAKQAGLIGKGGNWAKYPAAMLRSRCITEAARMAASDVLHGLVYTPEELGATIDESGEVVYGANPNPQPVAHAERRQQDRPAPAPQQGGMAGLANQLQQTATDPAVAFDDFVTSVEAATDKDVLRDLYNKAPNVLPADLVDTARSVIMARVGQLDAADLPAPAGPPAADTGDATPDAPAPVDGEQQVLDAEVVGEPPVDQAANS